MEIWIVDDEKNLNQGLAMALEGEGCDVAQAYSLADLSSLLAERTPDVVLLDVRLPDGDGISALPAILRARPEAKVIVMTAYGDSPTIVRAIQEGAYDFLDKPFPLEAVKNLVARASESILLKRRLSRLSSDRSVTLVGDCPAVAAVRDLVEKVSGHTDVNLLLSGESGTGKEVVARLLHDAASGAGDLIALNCAAIPEALLEAELFGYRKGAFTGAAQDKTGLIEAADGGTLNLKQRVEQGSFRQDLFYRISMIPACLPPLRERGRDVLLLAETFLAEFNRKMNRSVRGLTPEVEEVFLRYPWPGNVRELRNVLERVFILKDPADPDIRLSDLPAELVETLAGEPGSPGAGGTLEDRLLAGERTILERAMAEHDGNRTRAAESLGISRYALLRKLQKHRLA